MSTELPGAGFKRHSKHPKTTEEQKRESVPCWKRTEALSKLWCPHCCLASGPAACVEGMTVQISAASSADAAVLVLHEERCAQQLSASCTVLTEQDRVKDVLVFSGFMELKFYVGYSFFTAKALFTGEYQPSLCRTWELSQHSMHHLSSR